MFPTPSISLLQGYGRVPSYLLRRKVEGEEETAEGRKKQEEEEIMREKISQLKAEEKQELIEVRKGKPK